MGTQITMDEFLAHEPVTQYLALIERALSRPAQYRTGIEFRANQLWSRMTGPERELAASAWACERRAA